MIVASKVSFILSGDVERAIEQEISGGLGHSDVLKVAHHGSRTSSTESFLSAVNPGFALISAGFENGYGHPHPTVVDRLREHHAEILRTDLDGMITIRTDGHRLHIDTFAWR